MFHFKGSLIIALTIILILFSGCLQEPDRPVYVNFIFNQNQYLYEDLHARQIVSPLPRFYVVQNYFGLAHRLKNFSDIHLTVNINPVLIKQIEDNYLERLKPLINLANETFDVEKFRESYLKKTDPWIDMLLTDTWELDHDERDLLYNLSGEQTWHCLSVDESVIDRFPDYCDLLPDDVKIGRYSGHKKRTEFSNEDKTNLKFLFNLSAFDPLFLREAVRLPIRNENYEWVYSKVHKWVKWNAGNTGDPSDDTFRLINQITEEDCHQLVVEIYKVLASYLPAYQRLQYNERRNRGQIELTMTPMYNPPLSLIMDSNLADKGKSDFTLPDRYYFPEDAKWQLRLSIAEYKLRFDQIPKGIWSREGIPANETLNLYGDEGIFWLSSILKKEWIKKNAPNESLLFSQPYSLKYEGGAELAVFPEQEEFSRLLSSSGSHTENSTNLFEFLNKIRRFASVKLAEPIVTIVDNDQYRFNTDRFILTPWTYYDSLFIHLDSLYKNNKILTLTPIEFIRGNKSRNITAHPIKKFVSLDSFLINREYANSLNNWIGKNLQNLSWEYLRQSREVMLQIKQIYNPDHPNSWILRAWKELFISQNSDWFRIIADTEHFSYRQRKHLSDNHKRHMLNVFYYLNRAGFDIKVPAFPNLFQNSPATLAGKAFSTDPTINGRKDRLWKNEASFMSDDDGSTVKKKDDVIKECYWGYDNDNAFIAFEATSSGFEKRFMTDSLRVSILSLPADKNQLSYDERNSRPDLLKSQIKGIQVYHFRADSAKVAVPDTLIKADLKKDFMEISIPWKILKKKQQDARILIMVRSKGRILDYFPNAGLIEFIKE